MNRVASALAKWVCECHSTGWILTVWVCAACHLICPLLSPLALQRHLALISPIPSRTATFEVVTCVPQFSELVPLLSLFLLLFPLFACCKLCIKQRPPKVSRGISVILDLSLFNLMDLPASKGTGEKTFYFPFLNVSIRQLLLPENLRKVSANFVIGKIFQRKIII